MSQLSCQRLHDCSVTDLVALPFICNCIGFCLLQRFQEGPELLIELERDLAKLCCIGKAPFAVWFTGVTLKDEVIFQIFFIKRRFLKVCQH